MFWLAAYVGAPSLGAGEIWKPSERRIQTHDALLTLPEKILFYLGYAAILIAFARQKKTFKQLIVYSMLGSLT